MTARNNDAALPRRVRRKTCVLLVAAGMFAAGSIPENAMAAEGGLSNYLPGSPGEFGLALPPDPGLQLVNIFWYQSGKARTAVLQGAVDFGLDVTVALDLVGGFYTFEEPVLGARYSFGVVVPFGYAGLEANITGPFGGTFRADADDFNISDTAFTPLQLNWAINESFFVALSETIIVPTGAYSTSEVVNLGRNYWAFDTNLAATWFNAETGSEISARAGIMVNTENKATNYKTGTEFHLDYMANQFVSETIALGIRGYWYQQLTGDGGSGALLGDFKSSSAGIGAGILWTPASANGKLSISGKWMHDFHAKNRFKADYGMLTLGLKL
jgi:hypothetical protein